jgi:quercetin dioxygenase-like cupin family protein
LVTTVIWSTDRIPADISAGEDIKDAGDMREIKLLPEGTQFVIVDLEPGTIDVWHRTETIDYVIVISGVIEMGLDDSVTKLEAGDVVVQRGTNHVWSNLGNSPARLAAVLIDAKPLRIGKPKSEL